MVMSTGTIRPSLACAWVAALNSLQKPMMFTPCWPSAGPTGGEGFAFPAGSCSLTIPVTFFTCSSCSSLLHLHEIQLDGGEGAVHHAHVVAFLELHLGLGLERSFGQLGGQPRYLVLADRGRLGSVPHES